MRLNLGGSYWPCPALHSGHSFSLRKKWCQFLSVVGALVSPRLSRYIICCLETIWVPILLLKWLWQRDGEWELEALWTGLKRGMIHFSLFHSCDLLQDQVSLFFLWFFLNHIGWHWVRKQCLGGTDALKVVVTYSFKNDFIIVCVCVRTYVYTCTSTPVHCVMVYVWKSHDNCGVEPTWWLSG